MAFVASVEFKLVPKLIILQYKIDNVTKYKSFVLSRQFTSLVVELNPIYVGF